MATITAPSRRFFHPIQRDAATFLETAAESDGTRTLIQVELAPGGGNALHRHMTYELAVLAEWADIRISGPLRKVQPIFGLLARRARAKGIDRELAQRYVTL